MNNNIKSIWITANAGSGKTTALTERVVRLMLLGVAPERICCITFTKAAAGEMRARVLKFLREQLMLAAPANRTETITRLLGQAPSAEIEARAVGLFTAVLDSVHGGPLLTTIHGFCQFLLTRFPLEAGLPPHFTVLEDATAETLLRHARLRVLRGAGEDPALRAALGLIGERMGESRFSQLMQAVTSRRGHWLALLEMLPPAELLARLRAWHAVRATDEAALIAAFCETPDTADAAQLRASLPQWFEVAPEKAALLARWLETAPAERYAQLAEYCTLFLTQEGTIRKQLLPKPLASDAALAALMARLAQQVSDFFQQRAALACVEETMAMATLARAFLAQYEAAKAFAQGLDYDDLIAAAARLLASPTMLGWVMERLDHRIDHLLIDEAQDTSAAQWQIARVLVEELIANGGGIGSGGVPRSLLVVGDEKQSIYSFQGAAPELFREKYADFEALLAGSAAPLTRAVLDMSYRSSRSVLAVVDAVASLPDIAPSLAGSAGVLPHKLVRATVAGRVVLHAPIPDMAVEALPPLSLPLAYPSRSSVVERLAQCIAASVRAQVDAGRAPGDILILLHERNKLMLPLIRALQRQQVAVAGLDRLVLPDHLAVRDLLALLAWCTNPMDDLALAQVLRSPLVGWSDDQLRGVAYGRSGSLWQAVELEALERWRILRHETPYVFLTTVLEVEGARARFARRFGAEVHEVLDELKAQAAQLPAGMPPTLSHFYDWLAASRRQIKREVEQGGSDAVRVMTVHGAKGLEAPVVMLADLARIPTTQKEPIFFAPDAHGQLLPVLSLSDAAKNAPRLVAAKDAKKQALLAEYHRLLYVALTRACDELHVFGVANKKGEVNAHSWYDAVRRGLRTAGAQEEGDAWVLANAGASTHKARAPSLPPETLPAWAQDIAVSPASAAWHAPSQLGDAVVASSPSPYVAQPAAAAKERGVRIHRVLELMGARDDAAYLRQLIAHVAPDWEESEQAAVQSEIEALRQAHGWLWASPRLAEASIAGTIEVAGAKRAASGQIDLLVETPEGLVLVDYKTGRHLPETPWEVSASYRLQLKTYRALVAALHPQKPLRTALLWTSHCQLMWMDDVLDATPWDYQNVINNSPVAA